ncbi:dihydrofolate reductase family protein [Actinomadura sp. 9N407]|uniref:dihydrofolate reductase family protein n=1 Tax=Actinomadura sp. 9N407 TaxID=3375154 RepID=UPI0037B272E6
MGKVIYSMSASLDGFVEDPDGGIGFTTPSEEVHQTSNDLVRSASAFLFGRRLYEVMEDPWRTIHAQDDASPVEAEFAQIYLDTPRYVFSDTLETVPEGVTIVRSKDAVDEVARLKKETDGPLNLGGPELAASLLDQIDEFWLYLAPVLIGGGKPYFPKGRDLNLRLIDSRTFDSGTVRLRYEPAS